MNERIKQVRTNAKLTQTEFADKLGLTKNYISLVENGNREPSDRTIADICRIFDIRKEWLLTGEGEMKEPRTREEEIADLVGQALNGSNDFKLAVVKMICSRTDKELEALEAALRNIYESL